MWVTDAVAFAGFARLSSAPWQIEGRNIMDPPLTRWVCAKNLMRSLLIVLSLQSARAADILSITFESMAERSSTENTNGKS